MHLTPIASQHLFHTQGCDPEIVLELSIDTHGKTPFSNGVILLSLISATFTKISGSYIATASIRTSAYITFIELSLLVIETSSVFPV